MLRARKKNPFANLQSFPSWFLCMLWSRRIFAFFNHNVTEQSYHSTEHNSQHCSIKTISRFHWLQHFNKIRNKTTAAIQVKNGTLYFQWLPTILILWMKYYTFFTIQQLNSEFNVFFKDNEIQYDHLHWNVQQKDRETKNNQNSLHHVQFT